MTKEEAIKKVEAYLAIRNQRPNIHVFKIPIYTHPLKKLKLFFLKWYLKLAKGIPLDFPEWKIKPDSWKKSIAIEIVWKEYIKDLGVCWSIPYCTIDYYHTQEIRFGSIGEGPIFVDKEDGKMYQTGSTPLDWLESFKKFKSGLDTEPYPK